MNGFRIEHEQSYCHSCQTTRERTIEWWSFKPGSKYYPTKDKSDGSDITIKVCPGCIRAVFRDTARDTRYMHWNDCKYYEDQFWHDEVEICVKRAKELCNELKKTHHQIDDDSKSYLPAHLIAVPDDGDVDGIKSDKMELEF